MDKSDKTEERQLSEEGKGNKRYQEKRVEEEKTQCKDDRGRKSVSKRGAGQIWATATLGRWLRVLSTVYSYCSSKTSRGAKVKPAAPRLLPGGRGYRGQSRGGLRVQKGFFIISICKFLQRQ